MSENVTPVKHDVPKCTCCGHIEEWKVEGILRPVNIIIGLFLLILGFIPGVVYFIVTVAVRANKNNRAKICKNCKARNMFTYLY